MKKWLIATTASIALVGVAAGVAIAQGGWRDHGRHHGYHHEYGRHGEHGARRWGRHGGKWRGRHGMRRGARLGMLFDELDADGDGKLTKEEIGNAKARRFSLMDANKDGAVDAEEIMAYRMKRRAQMMVKRLDKNGDGKLSADEIPFRAPRLERFDLDENGVITKTEIEQARKGRGWRRSWRRPRPDAPAKDGPAPKAPAAE
ncbi:MAG: EF-hand domain-containing protein [Neomegalonema sp.]|nr:EF-hand domain-containing protein [Neomegalonema sp.]